jgi:hypothetical protein
LAIWQVNSGVLGVCTAFLSEEPATRLRSQELQELIAALLEFMAVCKKAIRIHARLIELSKHGDGKTDCCKQPLK